MRMPGGGQFGNMLLCRTPLLTVRHHLLPKYGSLGPMSLQRSARRRRDRGTRRAPAPVFGASHAPLRRDAPAQIEALLKVHESAVREGPPVSGGGLPEEWTRDGMPPPVPGEAILLGDFNMEPDSIEYERIVGPTSPYGRPDHEPGRLRRCLGRGRQRRRGRNDGRDEGPSGPARLLFRQREVEGSDPLRPRRCGRRRLRPSAGVGGDRSLSVILPRLRPARASPGPLHRPPHSAASARGRRRRSGRPVSRPAGSGAQSHWIIHEVG